MLESTQYRSQLRYMICYRSTSTDRDDERTHRTISNAGDTVSANDVIIRLQSVIKSCSCISSQRNTQIRLLLFTHTI